MKKFTKLLFCILSACLVAVSVFGCNTDKPNGGSSNGATDPDYSSSGKQFTFWGYSSVSDGKYTINGISYDVGTDFRTVEKYVEYKDAGMTLMFPQHAGGYRKDQVWETSVAKKVMDDSVTAGFDKVILNNHDLQNLSKTSGGVVGKGKQFATVADLDAYVTECMKDYRNHPAFYGVMLADEPHYEHMEAIGQVYRSIKRVCPTAFVQCCLWPPVPANVNSYKPTENPPSDSYECWRAYLNKWFDETGADYVMYDQYPLNTSNGVHPSWHSGIQIAAEVCKQRGARLRNVTQTCAYGTYTQVANSEPLIRKVTEIDARYLTNTLVGSGADAIAFFNYFTKAANYENETYVDGASFLKRNGQKTEVYTFMQKILGELQKLAPTILSFEFNASKYVRKLPCNLPIAANCKDMDFDKNVEVIVSKETALVTELKDAENGRYMYMVMNAIDPAKSSSETHERIEIKFEGCNKAIVFEKGEQMKVDLTNSTYAVGLLPGEAVFILPY